MRLHSYRGIHYLPLTISELFIRPALIWTLIQQILQIAEDILVMRPGHLNYCANCYASLYSHDTVTEPPIGAYTSAFFYSHEQTARLNGVNPYYYLGYVLEKMSYYLSCMDILEQDLQDLMSCWDKLKEAVQCYEKE